MRLPISIFLMLTIPIAAVGEPAPAGADKDGPGRRPGASKTIDAATAPANANERYTDRMHGFSLRPPPGTERIRQSSPRRLVGWIKREPKTGAIRCTLEILQTKHKPSKLPLSQYAQAVARELARTNNFKVDSTRLAVVAGKPAIHFRGLWKGAFKLWRRQTWVKIESGKYLVLDIAGPVTDKDKLDAILTTVVGSLRLFDPAEAIAETRRNLKRGSAVLKGLSTEKLRAILVDQPGYYTIKLNGKTIGFIEVSESIAQHSKTSGLRIVRRGALNVPKQPRSLTWERSFATADRKTAFWKRVAVEGRGNAAVGEIQEGIIKGNMVLVETLRPGQRPRNWKRQLPESIRSAYLPKAFDALLMRLLDRSKPTSYAFAMYNADRNDFSLKTVRIVGPETIRMGLQKIKATRLTIQANQQSGLANIWVDKNGLMLRAQMSHGLTMERTDRKSVFAGFAAELKELDKLAKIKSKP